MFFGKIKNAGVCGAVTALVLCLNLSINTLLLRNLVLNKIPLPFELTFDLFKISYAGIVSGFYMTGLSVMLMFSAAVAGFLIFIYFFGFLRKTKKAGITLALFLVAVGSMNGVLSSADLLSLFVYWEIFSFCFFILLKVNRRVGGKFLKFIFFCKTTAAFFGFLAFYYLFSKTGTLRLSHIFWQVSENYLPIGTFILTGILLTLSIFLKSICLAFLGWYRGSMSIKAFFISIASVLFIPLNIVVFLKIYPVLAESGKLLDFISFGGVLTAVLFSVFAWNAGTIFGIVLFSALVQCALAFCAIASGSSWQGIFFLIGQMFSALLLVLCTATVYFTAKTSDLKRISMSSYCLPVTYFCFWAAYLSLAGIFPFWGFFSKKEIFNSFYISGSYIYVIIILVFLLTAAYMTRFMVKLFYARHRFSEKNLKGENNPTMIMPQITAAFLLFFGGFALSSRGIFENVILRQPVRYAPADVSRIYLILFSVILSALLLMLYFYIKKEKTPERINRKIGFLSKFTRFVFRA